MNRSVSKEAMQSIFPSVGMIIVGWTFFESSLDAWSAIAYHHHGGNEYTKNLPRQFAPKTKFLMECFEKSTSLSAFKSEAMSMIENAKHLAHFRDLVVHGVLSHFDPSDASFSFVKLKWTPDKKIHVVEEHRVLGAELLRIAEQIEAMGRQSQSFTRRLLEISTS